MIKADIVCDICGKKRGRPNNHDLCAIKRKAKHGKPDKPPATRHKYTKEADLKYISSLD